MAFFSFTPSQKYLVFRQQGQGKEKEGGNGRENKMEEVL